MLSGSFCLCIIEHLEMAGSLGGLNPLLGERLFIGSGSGGRGIAEVTARAVRFHAVYRLWVAEA